MTLGIVLLIICGLGLLGVIPIWGHSVNWGYVPTGLMSLIVIAVLVLVLTGRI